MIPAEVRRSMTQTVMSVHPGGVAGARFGGVERPWRKELPS